MAASPEVPSPNEDPMRKTILLPALIAACIAAQPALASMGGGGSSPPPTPSSSPDMSTNNTEKTPRQEAEKWYGDAYNEVAKAKQDVADGKKQKNLDKRWRKASDKAERAVEIDPTYHEAWNLVGYCARQLKDYDKSLGAYGKCLAINPNYAPAREYMGEACVEQGKLPEAREQLAMLEKLNATDEASRLKTAIDAYVSAHPDAAAAAPAGTTTSVSATPAAADTSSGKP
jgi:tetratricopeptide (TPR) repeat protein